MMSMPCDRHAIIFKLPAHKNADSQTSTASGHLDQQELEGTFLLVGDSNLFIGPQYYNLIDSYLINTAETKLHFLSILICFRVFLQLHFDNIVEERKGLFL